eukprot:CAMPEP_0173397230 /NCGR_PEP_ID=MMETSP1356-20130122/37773_1 /TAXON_ID=77927 ORGANISM="Hemiselmis virescens, Strain PCC157" /NCGR_SAMPLE_ID=MMETSP1356 /ASSEMBLY_ACC=CAM_ASM_000847 /LENGTH=60 /DNA_ID=CAMNT_0014356445 /DNA_START=271 /DNA_END=453 /DNA_ORIENTATION=+
MHFEHPLHLVKDAEKVGRVSNIFADGARRSFEKNHSRVAEEGDGATHNNRHNEEAAQRIC